MPPKTNEIYGNVTYFANITIHMEMVFIFLWLLPLFTFFINFYLLTWCFGSSSTKNMLFSSKLFAVTLFVCNTLFVYG